MSAAITKIDPLEILDSRGNPTLGVLVPLEHGHCDVAAGQLR